MRHVSIRYANVFLWGGAASRFWQLGLNDGADSLGEYLDTVRAWAAENAVPVPQAVIEVHVIDDSDKDVGHVFVLHALPDGRVQLYQSFISQYSLQAHLQSTKPFDQAAMSKFVDQLRTLERVSYGNWMLHADAAYRSAFKYKGDAFAYKHAAGHISVTWSVTCIVPPWNGTHADVYADGQFDAADLFLEPGLRQAYSIMESTQMPAFEEQLRNMTDAAFVKADDDSET